MAFSDMTGLFVPILTPFKFSGEIDFANLGSHLDFLEKAKVEGILLMSVTGEFPSLSFEEKKALTDFIVDRRGNMKLLVSTGSCSLMETIEITKYCESRRVDGVVISLPFFFTSVHADGILNYCAMIFENTSAIPIILYNIPQYTRAEIDERLLNKLCDYEHMYGILDESGNFFNILGFMRNFKNLKIFSANDANIHLAASARIERLVSPLANIVPGFMLEAFKKVCKGENISNEQKVIYEFYKVAKTANNMGAFKFLAQYFGLKESQVRPPLLPFEDARKKELVDYCVAQGWIQA